MLHTNSISNISFRIGPKSIHFGPHFISYEKMSHMIVYEKICLVRVFFTKAMCQNKKTTIDFVLMTAIDTNEFILRLQLFANKHVHPHTTFYPFFPDYTFYPRQAFKHHYQFFPSYHLDTPIDLSNLAINPSVWKKEIQLLQDLAKLNPRLRSIYSNLFGYFDLILKHKMYKGPYIEFLYNIYNQAKSTPLNQWELVQVEQLRKS